MIKVKPHPFRIEWTTLSECLHGGAEIWPEGWMLLGMIMYSPKMLCLEKARAYYRKGIPCSGFNRKTGKHCHLPDNDWIDEGMAQEMRNMAKIYPKRFLCEEVYGIDIYKFSKILKKFA